MVARVLQEGEAIEVVECGQECCRIVRIRRFAEHPASATIAGFDAWLDEARPCGVRVIEVFVARMRPLRVPAFAYTEEAFWPKDRSMASTRSRRRPVEATEIVTSDAR